MIHRIRTIDAHAAGEPLRLVVEGMPAPEGRTMLEKRAWAMKRLDHLRKALILEPRGHTDMYGALLTEPVSRDAHAGILFMHNEGWSTMCGHGIIAELDRVRWLDIAQFRLGRRAVQHRCRPLRRRLRCRGQRVRERRHMA